MADTLSLFQIADTAEDAGNYVLARKSFEHGACLGNADCMSRLARMYDIGLGVKVDKSHAMRLYKRAWRRGSSVAPNNIAILYREQGKRRLMFQWFKRAVWIGMMEMRWLNWPNAIYTEWVFEDRRKMLLGRLR